MFQSDKKWLISQSEQKLATNFSTGSSSIITKVAAESPGFQLGLEPGDYIVSINESNLHNSDFLNLLCSSNEQVSYQFYSFAKHSFINVVAQNIPLGIISEPSNSEIIERIGNYGFQGWTDLEILWKRRKWDLLIDASNLVSDASLFSQIVRVFSKNFLRSAEILFKGAAIFENGNPKAGIEMINWFINKELHNHETSLHAIAYFYAAKWAESCGQKDTYQYWLSEANHSNSGHFERIAQEVFLKSEEAPAKKTEWVSEVFPLLYNLKELDTQFDVSLQETLDSMQVEELLPICVMPSYRGNGPYNVAMQCYRAIYPFISHRIKPMQVVLDTFDKRSDRAWWYENEEHVLEAGIPLQLLVDIDSNVSNRLGLQVSPVFYLLNSNGKIIYEGELKEPYYYWHALSL